MKKFIAPVVLLVLTIALGIYLCSGLGGPISSFDPEAYLAARSKIDSLEMSLWEAQGNPEASAAIRSDLDAAWETLVGMRNASGKPVVNEGDVPLGANSADDSDTVAWILGGIVAVALCVVALFFVLKRRKEYLTRQMEKLKTQEMEKVNSDPEQPFVAPARPKKKSIIDEAEAYAAKKRETQAQQAQPKETPKETPAEVQKVAFEDENGIPENKILTEEPGRKPALRPTARERITSAMRNLSDVLRSPRGVSREHTMKIRTQSRNTTGDPNLNAKPNPMKTSRFDREATEKVRVLQLSRRGFPASAIASTLKIPQDKVEAIIKESLG